MKKAFLAVLCLSFLFSCKQKSSGPDLSGIRVAVTIDRFDKAFFAIDTNAIPEGLQQVQKQFPAFYTDFMQQILGVDGADSSSRTRFVTKEFLRTYRSIYDSVSPRYANTSWLQQELEQAFRYVKYYFPDYPGGHVTLFLGPFDAPGVAATRNGLAVGLQQYAGSNFSVYQSEPGQELFPLYISRRFAPEYITANCMKAVIEDLFPDQSASKPLVEQMVEKGKRWYLLDKLLPEAADSVKTGYTQHQLDWCKEYEGKIWSYIVKNEDLQSLTPSVIQTYIGEGPFTQGLSQEDSPGNIGQWIGWQLVKKFAGKNQGMNLRELMQMDPKKILEEAKYKPK